MEKMTVMRRKESVVTGMILPQRSKTLTISSGKTALIMQCQRMSEIWPLSKNVGDFTGQ